MLNDTVVLGLNKFKVVEMLDENEIRMLVNANSSKMEEEVKLVSPVVYGTYTDQKEVQELVEAQSSKMETEENKPKEEIARVTWNLSEVCDLMNNTYDPRRHGDKLAAKTQKPKETARPKFSRQDFIVSMEMEEAA